MTHRSIPAIPGRAHRVLASTAMAIFVIAAPAAARAQVTPVAPATQAPVGPPPRAIRRDIPMTDMIRRAFAAGHARLVGPSGTQLLAAAHGLHYQREARSGKLGAHGSRGDRAAQQQRLGAHEHPDAPGPEHLPRHLAPSLDPIGNHRRHHVHEAHRQWRRREHGTAGRARRPRGTRCGPDGADSVRPHEYVAPGSSSPSRLRREASPISRSTGTSRWRGARAAPDIA